MQAMVVKEDLLLSEAVNQFATNHDLRGIFLTDASDRISGIINKRDLLNWVSMQLSAPQSGRQLTVGQMRRLLKAQKVSDLAVNGSEDAAVRLDETLADALEKMTHYELADIPVVDENGRIVNDLRLSEILAYMLNDA